MNIRTDQVATAALADTATEPGQTKSISNNTKELN